MISMRSATPIDRVALLIVSGWFESYGWGEVAAGLFTGSYPQDARDVATLRAAGVTAVVNLCRDEEYRAGARAEVARAYAEAGIVEHRLGSVDYGNVSPALLDEGTELVGAALARGDVVYVHCRAGWQRSATLAAAALAVRDGVGPAAALAAIRARRPMACPLPHQERDLFAWWNQRRPPEKPVTSGGRRGVDVPASWPVPEDLDEESSPR